MGGSGVDRDVDPGGGGGELGRCGDRLAQHPALQDDDQPGPLGDGQHLVRRHVAEDRDALDVADFELAAVRLLGAEVRLYSDRVLSKLNVSPVLVAARPL